MIPKHAEIRIARQADAEEIVEVIQSGFEPSLLDTFIYGCSGIASFVRYNINMSISLSDTIYVVASVRDGIAGCVELRYHLNGIFLNYISIRSEYRSSGLAKQLLMISLDCVRKPHHKYLLLDVLEHNSRARDWYMRLGFERQDSMIWCNLPLTRRHESASTYVTGYPQAEAAHNVFGFSQFTLNTAGMQYAIGRIGHKWFRVTQVEALTDPAVIPSLWRLGPGRNVLAIIPEVDMPDIHDEASLITRTFRMSVSLDRLTRNLSA